MITTTGIGGTCSAIADYQSHVRPHSGKKLNRETTADLIVQRVGGWTVRLGPAPLRGLSAR
jgi:hypothetical protein